MALSGCPGTGAKGGEVREGVEGASFTSCNTADPPAPRSGSTGNARFELRGRALTLKPAAAATALRLALFSGADLGPAPTDEQVAQLRDTKADAFVVLGGLGRTRAQAATNARALASLQRLVLVIRGGADPIELEQGDTGGLVLDASALRTVRIGHDVLLPWPGAEQGRYALEAQACGFGPAELKAALDDLGPKEVGDRRWLTSWQAPEPSGALAELTARARVDGVFCAWPAQAVGDQTPELSASLTSPHPQLVPRAWGPALEGADGSVSTRGVWVLRFEADGPHRER